MQYKHRETMSIKDFKSQFKNENIININRINRNTFQYNINKESRVRLYETDILIEKNNYIILNTGGFNTRLTMDRLNDLLDKIFPFRIYIKINKSIWYLINKNNNPIRFFNGIKINRENGEILNKNKAPNFDKIDKKNKKIIGLINKYCLKIKNMEELPKEYKGDCFYCQFQNKLYSGTEKEHLLLHLKEKYVMKSLILNALKENMYLFPLFIYTTDEPDRKLIISAVKKYFKNHLLIK